MKNYYRILEIEPGADEEAIERAYQRLTRRFERNPSNEAKARLRNVTEAYEVLIDRDARAEYDRKLSGESRRARSAEPLSRGMLLGIGVIVAAAVAVAAGIVVAVVLLNGGGSSDELVQGTPFPTPTLNPNITPGPATPPAIEAQPTVTGTGLAIYDIAVGEGPAAVAGSTVTVHYTGWLEETGTKFDSSLDRGEPFPVTLGQDPPQVIAGWEEGLLGVQAGGKRRLIIPPDLAYGDTGSGSVIPPNATLIFDIDIVEVTPPIAPATPSPEP